MSRSMAAVEPEPANSRTQSASAPTASLIMARASSRSCVVCQPVPLLSVWVLAYAGSTLLRMVSSMKSTALPLAV